MTTCSGRNCGRLLLHIGLCESSRATHLVSASPSTLPEAHGIGGKTDGKISLREYRGHRLYTLAIGELGTHIGAIETQVWK